MKKIKIILVGTILLGVGGVIAIRSMKSENVNIPIKFENQNIPVEVVNSNDENIVGDQEVKSEIVEEKNVVIPVEEVKENVSNSKNKTFERGK